jgi:hypothetical protein
MEDVDTKFLTIQNGCAIFQVVVPLDKCRLLVDIGSKPPQRLIDADMRSVGGAVISDAQWDVLEQLGVEVPINSNRMRPYFGPQEFCRDYAGGRNSHGAYIDFLRMDMDYGKAGDWVCAYCARKPNATPADPMGLNTPKKGKRRDRK